MGLDMFENWRRIAKGREATNLVNYDLKVLHDLIVFALTKSDLRIGVDN